MGLGCLQNVKERDKIVAVVHDRLRHGFTYGLEGSEMDHGIYTVFVKEPRHSRIVATVDLIEGDIFPACYLLNALEAGHVAVRHIVRHNHFISCIYKFNSHMTADISGASGNKYCPCHCFFVYTTGKDKKFHYFCKMKRIIPYILLCLAGAVSASAQPADKAVIQSKVDAIMSDATFSQSVVGICARTVGGEDLVDINSEVMMLPASNMKLITTGAALHTLGADWQFETSLGYSGRIKEDGTLKGDLYIIGGGDPTIGSKDSVAVSVDRTFAQWEAIIRAAGIRRIEGHIVGDGRWFEGMAEEPTWLLNDAGTYYGAGTTGLMFYENTQSFSVSAGPEVGAPVNIKPYYPEAPWMDFRYSCSTGKEGTGDLLYMYGSDLAPVAEIRGTFGVDRAAKRLDCANKFPEYTCAHYFAAYLKKKGLECSEGAADMRLKRPDNPAAIEDITVIGSTFSPALGRIVFETNHASNNLFAETLLRTLGKELHDNACYDSSYVALNDVFKDLMVDISKGAQIQDGSGLSRQNYVSADFFCRFLEAMTESPGFGAFISSLPSPGGNGTLQYNMKSYSASMRNRIKVKSGSMNGVRCYSGYILPSQPEGKTIVFSILTNNCTSPTWKVRPLLDKVMAEIASGN